LVAMAQKGQVPGAGMGSVMASAGGGGWTVGYGETLIVVPVIDADIMTIMKEV